MPFANFKVPQGTMSAEQKEDLIHKTTAIFVGYFGEGVRPTPWSSSTKWPMPIMSK